MKLGTLGLCGGLVLMAGIALPATVAGHTSKTNTELILATFEDPEFTLANGTDATDSFSGQVASGKASCEKGRTVKLFRSPGNPVLVGEDTSDADGNWAVFSEDPGDGTYFATVAKKRTGSGNHKHICKPDKSPNLDADDEVGPTDSDADGYFSDEGGDCDDANASVNPGATELQNGIDDDCDGTIDEE